MTKLKFAANRLSLGSWSIPIARSSSQRKSRSRSASAMAVPIAKPNPIATETELSQSSTKDEHSSTPPSNVASKSKFDMVELAKIITRETEKLDKYLKESGSEMPGFDADSPANFPKLPADLRKSRVEIMRATKELGDLVTGPTESVRWMAWDHNNSLSLHAVYHYKIAQSFPINSTTTFAQIASKTGLSETNTRRLLRHAMTNRIFSEPTPGTVAHTAASRVLAQDPAIGSWVGFCVEDIWPAASRVVDALDRYPEAADPTKTGFCVANDTVGKEPMFVTFGKDPKRAKRMGGAMTSLTGGEGYEVRYLLDNYDWEAIDKVGGTLVDLGGSHGFVCVDLAKRYKNMKFVVQDLPKTIASAPELEGDLKDRIKYQAHDFHTPQPVKGADVYFFRWILHNQADKYALNMLRQLIPALKKGSRVVINDHCLRGPGEENPWDEKIMRTMDLVMLTLLNAQERSEEEFRELFKEADKRFAFKGVKRAEGCRMSVVEAVWEGEDFGGVEGAENEPDN